MGEVTSTPACSEVVNCAPHCPLASQPPPWPELPDQEEAEANLVQWEREAREVVSIAGGGELPPMVRRLEDYTSRDEGVLLEQLRSGAIALLRGSYFDVQRAHWPLIPQRREEISLEYFWSPEEAIEQWRDAGATFFLAISYPWVTPKAPDPKGYHLEHLAHIITEWRRQMGMSNVGIFLDFASMHQAERTPAEEVLYWQALCSMDAVFSHEHTAVLRLTGLPCGVGRQCQQRGWPFFERVAADSKQDAWGKIFEFGSDIASKIAEPLDLSWTGRFAARRGPPILPSDFEQRLASMDFGRAADVPLILAMHRALFGVRARATEGLSFLRLDWGPEEVRQLVRALPYFRHLRELSLNGNARITDEGGLLVLAALPHLHQLEVLGLAFCGLSTQTRSKVELAWRANGKAAGVLWL